MILQDLPKLVITLPRFTDRHAMVRQQLEQVGWQYTFFYGFDKEDWPSEYLEYIRTEVWTYEKYGSRKTAGRLAVLESHRLLMEYIIAEQQPHTLVLEDDVLIHPSINTLDYSGLPADFDMFFLAGWVVDVELQYYQGNICRAPWVIGTQAYVVSLAAARQLAQFYVPENGIATDWANRLMSNQGKSYIYLPTPITPRADGVSRVSGAANSYQMIRYNWLDNPTFRAQYRLQPPPPAIGFQFPTALDWEIYNKLKPGERIADYMSREYDDV